MFGLKTRYLDYRSKIIEELENAFKEDHTPHETAASFSIGVFVTSLPTLGTGLILFAVLARLFDRISKLALFASVLVLNPFIKPAVYVASINLGGIILTRQLSITTEPETLLLYLIVGNLVIGVILAVVSYFIALEAVKKYKESGSEVVEKAGEEIEKELEKKAKNKD